MLKFTNLNAIETVFLKKTTYFLRPTEINGSDRAQVTSQHVFVHLLGPYCYCVSLSFDRTSMKAI